MAVGNTFGATALSSYGGFWISVAIVLTPGGFEIGGELGGRMFANSFGLFLMVSRIVRHVFVMNLSLTSIFKGLVYLHHNPPVLHPQVNRSLLPPVLLPRHLLPVARGCLSLSRWFRRSSRQHSQGGWSLRFLGRVRCVV